MLRYFTQCPHPIHAGCEKFRSMWTQKSENTLRILRPFAQRPRSIHVGCGKLCSVCAHWLDVFLSIEAMRFSSSNPVVRLRKKHMQSMWKLERLRQKHMQSMWKTHDCALKEHTYIYDTYIHVGARKKITYIYVVARLCLEGSFRIPQVRSIFSIPYTCVYICIGYVYIYVYWWFISGWTFACWRTRDMQRLGIPYVSKSPMYVSESPMYRNPLCIRDVSEDTWYATSRNPRVGCIYICVLGHRKYEWYIGHVICNVSESPMYHSYFRCPIIHISDVLHICICV